MSGSWTGTAFDWLRIASRDTLAFLEDIATAVSAVGWLFVVLAALALLWVWADMHASTRLGPIEVAVVEHDGEPQPAVQALTAMFRERLSRVGLTPPPAVPDGAPQANIIQAVEASTLPQGAAIARLLEILPSPPRPAQYKVTATLFGRELRGVKDYGVSFWLQPTTGAGAAYLHTVSDCDTHADALTRAASAIYLHMAESTPAAFPLWVRWRDPESLEAYLTGCRLRGERRFEDAVVPLKVAFTRSPFNALAALQLANLNEQRAALVTDWATAYLMSQALVRYLAVARLWPTVVEARYRCSVTAAALATAYKHLEDTEKLGVEALLPLEPLTDGFAHRLRRLAARESSATVQLLKPGYTLGREHRLRNQFESKGRERRSLRHTVHISRHCVRMRKHNGYANGGWRLAVRYEDACVHVLHMMLGRANVTWQARYNAACFDALQLARPRMSLKRRRRVERRALRNLDASIREAAGGLTQDWVENDPDFSYFSDA